jgi:hypothetical protein
MNKDSDLSPELNYGDFAHADESLINETTRLLSELDQAIDHSSTLRDIIGRQEAVLELESITGSSRKTQILRLEITRLEITRLEQQLYAGPGDEAAVSDPSLSPA